MSGLLPDGVVRAHPEGCTLAVRVQPGAKRTAITGVYGESDQAALKIALQAPPIDGRANDALIAYLAEAFQLPQPAARLIQGQSSRSKVVLLRGVQSSDARSKLEAMLPSST